MFGAGALLVATSLPAVALQMNSASAFAPDLAGASNSESQSLAVDGSAADAALTRDPYTVVNTIQQARMKFGLQNFSYTNDTNGTIQWPFPAPVPISSGFGSRNSPCGGCSSFHEGVDFIPGAGTPIDAIADADGGFPSRPIVTLTGFRAKGYLLDEDSALSSDLAAAHRAAHGTSPRAFTLGSTTDARIYLNDFGIPAVCFGAVAHDMHGIDESVELQSIVDAARTLARFLLMRFLPDGARA